MPTLGIDIETYSEVDLPKCGVYAYAEHPSFEILLFAYAFDDEETQVVDLKGGERLPPRVLDALTDPAITKTAFNAAFERTCIGRCLGKRLDAAQWQCTAVQSAMLALPLSLEGVGEVLGIERKKLKEGGDLVRYFSLPCKPTKANGQRTRNLPEHAPEKWQRFKEYCVRDVEAEREIRAKLQGYPIPAKEQELYRLDQEINDRGIMVDPVLVARAIECDEQYREDHEARLRTDRACQPQQPRAAQGMAGGTGHAGRYARQKGGTRAPSRRGGRCAGGAETAPAHGENEREEIRGHPPLGVRGRARPRAAAILRGQPHRKVVPDRGS